MPACCQSGGDEESEPGASRRGVGGGAVVHRPGSGSELGGASWSPSFAALWQLHVRLNAARYAVSEERMQALLQPRGIEDDPDYHKHPLMRTQMQLQQRFNEEFWNSRGGGQ